MPRSTAKWRFVCWTPGDRASVIFTHRPEACRDQLLAALAAAQARVTKLEASARTGWMSAQAIAVAHNYPATERAAVKALAALAATAGEEGCFDDS